MNAWLENKTLAWVWALLVLAVALLLGATAWQGGLRINTDVLAMLPKDERRPEVERALGTLAKAGEGRLIVLIPLAAADRFIEVFARAAPEVQIRHRVDQAQQAALLDFFVPYRGALLTAAQRQQLQQAATPALAQQALQELMQPVGGLRLGAWAQDPLNSLGPWLAERALGSRVRVQQGRLSLPDPGGPDGDQALILIDSPASAFALAHNQRLADALARARAAVAPATVVAAGVPLHAHAAATQAQFEMHLIGLGSLLGVFVLSWLAFARIRPRLLVLLSVGSGLVVAVAATLARFGELHLITLVFGASLVGVAENYASSYYAARIERGAEERFAVMREQAPTLALALLTTLAGYGLLAATPFPGLQQVALFSAAGLSAAFLSTLLWFPHLDRGAVPLRPLTRSLSRLWARWPALPRRPAVLGPALLLLGLGVLGWLQGRANDDIRLLQATPPALLQDQQALAKRLELPSPAQFFLLSAGSQAELLAHEEALVQRLAALRAKGLIQGWQAVSDWVPSPARQQADFALLQRRWREVSKPLAEALGQSAPAAYAQAPAPLTVAAWLASPVSEAGRHQWLGADAQGRWHALLLLRGVAGVQALPELAALAGPGLRWVDKVAEVSELLARQRLRMAGILALAVLAVGALLCWRFGRSGWRALLPTLLAGALTLALLALAQQPLQLFHVLALLLLLGVGVDYGIFLLAQPARGDGRAFVSVTLAALCTLLAFGLLAFSSTPALRAFGLTLGVGTVLAWGLTPFFIPEAHGE